MLLGAPTGPPATAAATRRLPAPGLRRPEAGAAEEQRQQRGRLLQGRQEARGQGPGKAQERHLALTSAEVTRGRNKKSISLTELGDRGYPLIRSRLLFFVVSRITLRDSLLDTHGNNKVVFALQRLCRLQVYSQTHYRITLLAWKLDVVARPHIVQFMVTYIPPP